MIFVNITGPNKKPITSYAAISAPTKEESLEIKNGFAREYGCSPDEIKISTSTNATQFNKNILSVFGADGEFIVQTQTAEQEVSEEMKQDYAHVYGEGVELKITPYDQPYRKEIDEQQEQ